MPRAWSTVRIAAFAGRGCCGPASGGGWLSRRRWRGQPRSGNGTDLRSPRRRRRKDSVVPLRPIDVQVATVAALPKVASALADAFMNDPVFRWLVPGRVRVQARLRTVFLVEMEQYVVPCGGTVWTTAGYDGAVAELPPGAWEMPKAFTGRQALRWMRAFGRRLPRAIEVQHAMQQRHLQEPHFYVRTVGVRTALQGQGVGSALMQPTLKRADSAGVAAYIEASTERSAALYARLGFVHVDVLALPKGGPPVWLMRRPPRGVSPTEA